jgi:peptide methionine sulfoxide reductase msrA/msrB
MERKTSTVKKRRSIMAARIGILLLGLIGLTAIGVAFNSRASISDLVTPFSSASPTPELGSALNRLTEAEKKIIVEKGTDRAFTGALTDNFVEGRYYCRQCDAPLYVSKDKFRSNCGWPSFDQEIPGSVTKLPDADGERTEIICANCKGHLGHVFYGEGYTDKDTRHCVNSTSMAFVPGKSQDRSNVAVFAGGCFWGVEYYFMKEKGVKRVTSGYTGGNTAAPTYDDVLTKKTGHYEAVEIEFDPKQTNFETLARLFFEIHDPTQTDGQGADIGPQYLSAVFFQDEEQRQTAANLINLLETKGLKVATRLKPARKFWPAEEYHQRYYEKNGGTPYCHVRVKRF